MKNIESIIHQALATDVALYVKDNKLAYTASKAGVPEELKTKIKENKEEIIQYLLKSVSQSDEAKEWQMQTYKGTEPFPVSYQQQQVWFAQELTPGSQFNLSSAFNFTGEINLSCLKQALIHVIERHDVLRTVYKNDAKGGVSAQLLASEHFNVAEISLLDCDPSEQAHETDLLLKKEQQYIFNLSEDFAIRVLCIHCSEDRTVISVTTHHIASDGWSQDVFIAEFGQAYQALVESRRINLPKLPFKYRDFAYSQQQSLESGEMENQLSYWRDKLAGTAKSPILLTDYPRPNVFVSTGGAVDMVLAAPVLDKLKQFANSSNATLYMVLETALAVLISRWLGRDDLVIGSPIAGREHEETRNLIGLFVNLLPIRSQIPKIGQFIDFLHSNKTTILDAFSNQSLPFDLIRETVKVERDLSHFPLFQLVFNLQNVGQGNLDVGSDMSMLPQDPLIKFDLEVVAYEVHDGLTVSWKYADTLFKVETLQTLAESYISLLNQISNTASIKIEDLTFSDGFYALSTVKADVKTEIKPEVETCLEQLAGIKQTKLVKLGSERFPKTVVYILPDSDAADFEQIVSSAKQEIIASLGEQYLPDGWSRAEISAEDEQGQLDVELLPKYVFLPATKTENKIAKIWQSELPNSNISTTDNFFDLGGNSIRAMKITSKVSEALAVDVSFRTLFESSTLADYALRVSKAQGQTTGELKPASRQEQLPLSYMQERLWFIDKLNQGSPEYNMPVAFEVKGKLDLELVTKALNTIITRHEVLRTVYLEQNGQPVQVIRDHRDVNFQVQTIDLTHLVRETLAMEVKQFIEADIFRPFDLSSDLMVRVSYLATEPDNGVMVFNMHHISSDGWSMEVLTKEFFTLYNEYYKGHNNPLPALDIQYADFAIWQRDYLTVEVLESKLSQLETILDELPVVHSLPLDYERPANKQHTGAVVTENLPAETAQNLLAIAKAHRLTPFMLLHGALALVLSRHSGTHDIVIGTPVASRPHTELEPLIGFFVNTLVLRTNTQHQSLVDYFAHVRDVHLTAQSHQDVPFEHLVERLNIPRSQAHSPVFQIMMTTNTDYELDAAADHIVYQLPDVELQLYQSEIVQAKFDLNIDLSISEQGLGLSWGYDVSLFTEQHITQLNMHLCRLLEELSAQSTLESAPSMLAMLSKEEVHHLLYGPNDAAMDYPKDKCIHELFEYQAEQSPDNVAVVFEAQQLTYRQLNEKANQLAHYLKEHQDIKPDTMVGLCVERSLELVIGILGILKAGGAYVPLDPSYPEQRLSHMLADAKLALVLSQSQLQDALTTFNGTVINLDGLAATKGDSHICSAYSHENLSKAVLGLNAGHLAYVSYTSGVSGNPEGVLQSHTNVIRLFEAATSGGPFKFDSSDCWCLFHSTAVDFSVWELWGALNYGAKLLVPNDDEVKDLNKLIALCNAHSLTVLNQSPYAFKNLVKLLGEQEQALNALRYVVTKGEALNPHHVREWFEHKLSHQAVLVNTYGITEATVHVTHNIVDSNNYQAINIGKPLKDQTIYVLDGEQRLVPVGCVGEAYIGGNGLSRGYLNNPELTTARFVANPYYDPSQANSPEQLYRTGALVRYLSDGNVEFKGRADNQVKIRGFKIDLVEIEAQLTQHAPVDSAVVITEEVAGSRQLIGYIKPKAMPDETEQEAFIRDVKTSVTAQLPDYMVPTILMLIAEWPLTLDGKVDSKALPKPDDNSLQGEYIAPATKNEQAVVDILARLLDLDAATISTTANFFELGGYSLLFIQLVSGIKQLGLHGDTESMYKSRNLQEMASTLTESSTDVADFVVPENLIPEGCDHITPEMLPLVELTQSELDEIFNKVPGGASNIQDIYRLAPLQEGVLFIHNITEQRDPYVTCNYYEFSNKQSLEYFLSSLNFIIERHDVLRTAVLWRNRDSALQVVYKNAQLPIEYINFDDTDNLRDAFLNYVEQGAHRIELETAPLIQLQVVEDKQSGQYFALLKNHHLISDHVSLEIIMSEIAVFERGQADSLAAPVLYREFIARALHNNDTLDVDDFFTQQLGDVAEPSLPFGLSGVTADGSNTNELYLGVGETLSTRIRQVMRRQKLSPASFFHTVWAMVLSACCGNDDVVFGTVLSGRMNGDKSVANALGMMINTLPLRVTFNELDAKSLIEQVNDSLLALLPYEQASLAKAQRCSGLGGSVPLFSAQLNYRHNKVETFEVGLSNKILPSDIKFVALGSQERTNYPFNLSVNDNGEHHEFSYDLQIDKNIDVQRVADYMQTAVESLVKSLEQDDNTPVKQLSVLPASEVEQLVYALNDTVMEHSNDICIHELFEQQAAERPDAVAVVYEGEQLTYRELNQQANRLAHYLVA
ncbi:MAG TPA: amino acid adenylation domain-containing protein, partial [Methylophaga aminisulfidivorans]|nr:amino acid adenylation domain-containing protein [Methylophaga aminisulfidivorans]